MSMSRKEQTVNYAVDHLCDNGYEYRDINIQALNETYDRLANKGNVYVGQLADAYMAGKKSK